MADEPVVKAGDPGAPPAPTPGNPPAGDPSPDPAEGAVKTQDEKPLNFSDVIKHPEFQPFLDRQIEEKVAARTTATVAQVLKEAGFVKPPVPQQDPDAEDVKHVMSTFEMDEARAKELVRWRNTGIDRKTKHLESRFDQLDLSARFTDVFRENPDARKFEGTMVSTFNSMSDYEKNFVLYSQDGATFLYEKAKKRSGVLPPAARVAGGGSGPSASRTVPPSEKAGDGSAQVGMAVDALKKGNRGEYERLMAGVIRK